MSGDWQFIIPTVGSYKTGRLEIIPCMRDFDSGWRFLDQCEVQRAIRCRTLALKYVTLSEKDS
jgi:hypothetical protein